MHIKHTISEEELDEDKMCEIIYDLSTSRENNIECPICNHIEEESHTYFNGDYEEIDYECPQCGAKSSCEQQTIIEYHTTPKESEIIKSVKEKKLHNNTIFYFIDQKYNT